ncbi:MULTISPECIES: GOLPH3/VPS74 family protein [Streptomyces]|uniref:GPP34 family phosphoprotein n=1 Tax=Streptomyces cyaneofuscatus TaxID=66883 RepID=A0ABZ1EZW5_9ACTN|nr:GPP34 family phosphoprotein [Streptomyces cyaneofuscatus]WSB09631.1 GPP34 family phosphoprotein [Streptomyces cyaneofuscatus]WSD46835.1 GPP34 family phosphoprotein [Streptomyces cyaneofuscatus]WTA90234.1 GPP34 family phosphoprotein [Streptomyces cyaneofuscatus]
MTTPAPADPGTNPAAPVLTLPEELILLTLNPGSGKPMGEAASLAYGVAGAVLAELELQGRIREEHGRVQVVNPLDPADPRLAALLRTLPQAKGRRSGMRARHWVANFDKHVRDTYLDSLVERSVLSRETRRFLGLFPSHRHFPVLPDLVPGVRRRFTLAETAGYPDHRDRLLAALVSAIGLAAALTRNGRPGRTAMKVLRRSEWTAMAVHYNVKKNTSDGDSDGEWLDGGGGDGCGGGCGGGD